MEGRNYLSTIYSGHPIFIKYVNDINIGTSVGKLYKNIIIQYIYALNIDI